MLSREQQAPSKKFTIMIGLPSADALQFSLVIGRQGIININRNGDSEKFFLYVCNGRKS